MKLTTDQPSSSMGLPVFVDDTGKPIVYADAIKQLCRDLDMTYADLAEKTGVSRRTAEGWGQGRIPSKSALMLMSALLGP